MENMVDSQQGALVLYDFTCYVKYSGMIYRQLKYSTYTFNKRTM